MEQQSPMNNLKQQIQKELRAITAITAGTIVGTLVYVVFLIGKIDIFGFNLGCIVAPIVAGYVEVVIARRICDESTGAISAFILFLITVIYGFIIKNPTFGFNLLTIGISIIIIQAAIPIAMNYFIIVVVIALLTHFLKLFKKLKIYISFIWKRRF